MDMNNLMAQAQQMQERMQQTQAMLGDKRVEAESGGGLVKVSFNGRQELVGLSIEPGAVDPNDIDMLEDLILAAMEAGHRKAGELAKAEMGEVTGGLNIPGLF